MIVHGFQSHNTHPRGSEVGQMEVQTPKTQYVNVKMNICFGVFCVLILIGSHLDKCTHATFHFLLKRQASPSVEKRFAYSPTPERGRTTAQHRQERRDRERTCENKENIAVQEKDVDIFALPPPRTPVSSKKNARPNKNVLTTPNQNANASNSKTNAVTPTGKNRLVFQQTDCSFS